MGKGKSLPLADFYIAKPSDTAKVINEQLAAGKNIYFTPGIYHAEEPIQVTKEDTILLGTGMATIIPDNEKLAMEVADVDGVRVAGLIFDAGKSSEYLLVVGEEGKHTDHSANPIILQDLFFRIGGTTDELTKADNALEINSDNVIGDHFWIWRADHGAGVKWYGNESKHGLTVNGMGDSVSSGTDKETGEKGTGWDRTFLRYYNKKAVGSYRDLKKAYTELLNECNKLEEDKDKYTEESWGKIAPALEEARDLIKSTNLYVQWPVQDADKEAVSKLSTSLENVKEAEGGLQKSEKELIKEALAEELQKADELKEDDYTKESWAAYQEAITAAKTVSENGEATLEDLQNALKALQEARGKLAKPTTSDPAEQNPSVKLNASSIPLQKGKSTTALKVAKNGSSGHACMYIWRLQRGSNDTLPNKKSAFLFLAVFMRLC